MIGLLGSAMGSVTALAQEPMVRTSFSGDQSKPLWVGQGVTLYVELLAPGYFDSAASFDLPDPQGVLLMKSEGSPIVSNETINGVMYTTQRHSLRAWPMQAGNMTVPSFSIRFSYKRNPLDKQGEPATVSTRSLPLVARMPPGAQGLGTIISARGLQIDERWQPQPGSGEVKAGTAFKRTVTFSAPDVPGMLFPQFPSDPVDGLGIYARQALDDQQNRGELTGTRHDEITYVCKQAGQFTIPSTTYTWFDLDSRQLKTKTFPAQTLNVIQNTDLAAGSENSSATDVSAHMEWRNIVLIVAAIVLLVLVARTSLVRRKASAAIAYLKPVRLQALNPGAAPAMASKSAGQTDPD